MALAERLLSSNTSNIAQQALSQAMPGLSMHTFFCGSDRSSHFVFCKPGGWSISTLLVVAKEAGRQSCIHIIGVQCPSFHCNTGLIQETIAFHWDTHSSSMAKSAGLSVKLPRIAFISGAQPQLQREVPLPMGGTNKGARARVEY